MTDTLQGQCLCGTVRIAVAFHEGEVSACHCRMCQRWSGGVFFSLVAPADAVSVEGPVARYASSSFTDRVFCPTCGSHLWLRQTGDEAAEYELMPGLFDAAMGLPLDHESYSDRAPTWARFAGGHRRITAADYEAANPFVEGDAS